ncbi:MAG: hypothetical protein ABW217_01095 [Polyangiaceae bacterium]
MHTLTLSSRLLLALALALAAVACSGADADEPWVDIGLSAGDGGLGFARLEAGGEVPLLTFGQGGTHALLAIRCAGFGRSAFVNVTITNLRTGTQVQSAPSASPQLLICREPEVCDLVPFLVMTGGLTEPGVERDGLPIRIDAEAHNVAGERARTEREGVLSTREL